MVEIQEDIMENINLIIEEGILIQIIEEKVEENGSQKEKEKEIIQDRKIFHKNRLMIRISVEKVKVKENIIIVEIVEKVEVRNKENLIIN